MASRDRFLRDKGEWYTEINRIMSSFRILIRNKVIPKFAVFILPVWAKPGVTKAAQSFVPSDEDVLFLLSGLDNVGYKYINFVDLILRHII